MSNLKDTPANLDAFQAELASVIGIPMDELSVPVILLLLPLAGFTMATGLVVLEKVSGRKRLNAQRIDAIIHLMKLSSVLLFLSHAFIVFLRL